MWVNPTLTVKNVTVNPGDEEDFTCQENLIESYLVEEMLGFEEEEAPRSTGESVETTKQKKKIDKIN